MEKNTWRTIFSSVRTTCKETKLREFQFKFLHRIIVTKKELFRFGIKTDNECLYCGESDSIHPSVTDPVESLSSLGFW